MRLPVAAVCHPSGAVRKQIQTRPGVFPVRQALLHADQLIAAMRGIRRLRFKSLHESQIGDPGSGPGTLGSDLDDRTRADGRTTGRDTIDVQRHPEDLCYLPSLIASLRRLLRHAA